MFAYGETVTLLRATVTGRDAYGNDVAAPVEVEVPGCAVWPRGSSETTAGRDTVISGLSVLVPPGTVITATDQLRVRGQVYAVDGEPGEWISPLTGIRAGVEVALTRVTG